jgi:hypothetical protein
MRCINANNTTKHSLRIFRKFLPSRLAEELQEKAYAYLVPSGKQPVSKHWLEKEEENIYASVPLA